MTAQELAAYLELPVATVYAWRHRRQGPPRFTVGRHLRHRLQDVEQWIGERLQEEPVPLRRASKHPDRSGQITDPRPYWELGIVRGCADVDGSH